MNRKKMFLALTLLSFYVDFAQTHELKKAFTDAEKKLFHTKMREQIFSVSPKFNFFIGTADLAASIEKMNPQVYDADFFNKTQNALSKDPLHPLWLNNMAEYYKNLGKSALEKEYRQKSFANINTDFNHFRKDSAFYYSFRGILKNNLQMEGGFEDVDHALRINPNDSIATHFYPIVLIGAGKFEKIREISYQSLNSGKAQFPEMPLFYISMADLYEKNLPLFNGTADEAYKKKMRQTDYDAHIDLSILTKYAALYPDRAEIKNMRLIEPLHMVAKIGVFETDDKQIPRFVFSAHEKQRMREMEQWLQESLAKKTLNPYTAYKSLALLSVFSQNYTQAVAFCNKAIAVFPASKRSANFNPNECYELLQLAYYLKEDLPNFNKVTLEKIKANPSGVSSASDYLNLAAYALHHNELDNAETFAKQAREIEPQTSVFRVLSYLYFLQDMNTLAQRYIDEAHKYATSEFELYNIAMQVAMCELVNGNAPEAMAMFEQARQIPGYEDCPLCKKLTDEYIRTVPK